MTKQPDPLDWQNVSITNTAPPSLLDRLDGCCGHDTACPLCGKLIFCGPDPADKEAGVDVERLAALLDPQYLRAAEQVLGSYTPDMRAAMAYVLARQEPPR